MVGVILGVVLIIFLIAVTKNSKTNRQINETRERDESLKRSLELEILIKEAKDKGIDTRAYEKELAKMKEQDDENIHDPFFTNIPKRPEL